MVLIKIHIVFTIAYNTHGACKELFFSEIRNSPRTPFFWAKRPLSPPQKKNASAAKPILACLYKTLTMGARRSCGQLFLLVGTLRHAIQLQCHQIELLAIVET